MSHIGTEEEGDGRVHELPQDSEAKSPLQNISGAAAGGCIHWTNLDIGQPPAVNMASTTELQQVLPQWAGVESLALGCFGDALQVQEGS